MVLSFIYACLSWTVATVYSYVRALVQFVSAIPKSLLKAPLGRKKASPKPPCPHQIQAVQAAQAASPITTPSITYGPVQPSQDPPKEPIPGSTEDCMACKEEARAARKYRWKIIIACFFPFTLQALDVTIIASALPWIARDFGKVSEMNWIIAAFNLTSAAFIPFWAQLTDVFGRHAAFQACVVLMMVGSAICTGVPTGSYPAFLLGRAIQGIGCAGIQVIVRVILADRVSLQENAKNWTVFALVGGTSYALGPVLGGYLTSADWRWCFGINLPVAAVAVLLIFFVLRHELLGPQPLPLLDESTARGRLARVSRRLMTVDAGGQLLCLFGFGLLVLAFTWAGADYGWDSAAVIVPLLFGLLLVAAFLYWERLMAPGNALARRWPYKQSMLPWELIANRDIGLLSYINFATGVAMYAVLYFVNIYFTLVKNYSASKAGVQLLYYTPGLGVGVWVSMYMCNSFPRKTFPPIFLGSVLEAVGVGVLAWALWSEHTPTIFGMLALTGAGTGIRFMPVPIHALGIFPKHVATVVALMAVTAPLGGTIGLTIMSTVFNNTSGMSSDSDFTAMAGLPDDTRLGVIHNAKMGIVWAFVAITPLNVICIMAAMFLGNVNITKDNEGGSGHEVQPEIYPLSLLRGRSRQHSGSAEKGIAQDGDSLR